jgi:hypothetical protein
VIVARLPLTSARAGGLGAAAAVLTLALASSQPAAAEVLKRDTLAAPDCNSTVHRVTTQNEDEDWEVARNVKVRGTGKRNRRRLHLEFTGWREDARYLFQPVVARDYSYDQGPGYIRETTIEGEGSVAVRLHLGDARTIKLGVFKPDWTRKNDNNIVAYGSFGDGVSARWQLSISLRKHLEELRAHEYKAKGSRSRVSLTYKFPATRFVRQDGGPDVKQTTDWTSAECDLRSRRLRLTTR